MEKTGKQIEAGNIFRRNLLFVAALICLLAWMFSVGDPGKRDDYSREVAAFEKVLHKKEQVLKAEMSQLEREFETEEPMEVLDRRSLQYQELSSKKGISIFYYKEGALEYWSDHSIPLSERWRSRLLKPFLALRNADYVTLTKEMEGGILYGLIEVKTHFPFENEFLVSGFQKDFSIDPAVSIQFLEEEACKPVMNDGGFYLFSFDFSGIQNDDDEPGLFSRIIFSGFLLLFYAALFSMVASASKSRKRMAFWVLSLLIPAGAVLLLRYGIQPVFGDAKLFQPDLFASRIFASLGHLVVISVSVLALVVLFYRDGPVSEKGEAAPCRLRVILLFALASLMFLLVEQVLASLVIDSGISLAAHQANTLTIYSFVALAIILTWFTSIGMVIDRAITCSKARTWVLALTGAVVISATLLIARLLHLEAASWIGWGGMMLMMLSQLYIRFDHPDRVPFSRYIFLLFFISGFLVIRLEQYSQVKLNAQKEVELVKLSSEHDPVAEMLFIELSDQLRKDSVLTRYMYPYVDIEALMNHLQRNYFSGYWTKYELQLITLCRPDDELYLAPPDDEYVPCYAFFEEMMQVEGIEVTGSDFYFLYNLKGRISYLAVIPYELAGNEYRLFIELESRIISEELGYPELLLDEQYRAFTSSEFSYARYNQGVLVTRDGEFPFRRSTAFYTEQVGTFEELSLEGWDLSIYNVDPENTIIVGSRSVTMVDKLISFSYIFALSFLILAIVNLVVDLFKRGPNFDLSFKHRIQYSMVVILFLTFALICSGTIFFIVQQNRDKNNDKLRNTMRSVNIELIHKVEYEEDLRNWSSDSYYNLDELLRKFSNVFYSDINLYDESGRLLATSREEIFNSGLLSRRMNRLIFENLSGGGASELIHEEHIGELNYISAYVPLLNSNNEFLAYLNLPYFTQSGALTRDVTNMVVAVINIYLILLLVILGVSVFLSERITQPLRMIQSRIAHVSLSAKNETIKYERSDEIRGLVEEYNFMVQELERSAGLLAQSERESAWREMAKQIAHEIKNPLTPMRLNVQHLQRTMGEGEVDPERVERISASIIEQIDSLSAIANEFSDFAKMPKAKSDRVNLVIKLQNLLQLFEASERAEIILDPGPLEEVFIYADKEQLMRVFINLVKNGLQAIPRDRKGVIRIRLNVEDHQSVDDPRAVVTISDNGKGIPEEIRDKLFRPNFTTKSGGMGMGLAISSSIVRSLGGKIWYDSRAEGGTTFYISLPLMADTQETDG